MPPAKRKIATMFDGDSSSDGDEELTAALRTVTARVVVDPTAAAAAAKRNPDADSLPGPAKKAKKAKGDEDRDYDGDVEKENQPKAKATTTAAKGSKGKGKKVSEAEEKGWKSWRDVPLEGEDEGNVAIYDDCNEIRRKIRLLQKEPSFKITHWLREIGEINSNSFSRFMKASGPSGGAENGTYLAAYIYFEKVRIFEGKKKTATRQRNEDMQGRAGFSLRDARRGVWVIGPRR